jgi:hypothetical protein
MKWKNFRGAGRPSISARKADEAILSWHQMMVWLSSTVTGTSM